MAASDFNTATVKAALKGALPGVKDTGTAPTQLDRLTASVRTAVAAELGETAPDEDWDPDGVPAAMVVEACIRTASFLWQSRPKIGSRLVTDAAVGGSPVRASGARALLIPYRRPGVTVAS